MARVSRKPNKRKEVEIKSSIFLAGIYVRLSVEDIRKKESDSIGTQKELIKQYVAGKEDIEIVDYYEDVNYTGTNFDRPSFNRMIADLKSKKINCVIVKDLSRFGRNYLEAGNYLEYVFPFLGVRFISINDRYDSASSTVSEDGLILPLKNLMNEVYARDISKKVKSQYEIKRKRGDFCGAFAPYGYIKVDSHLEVDEEVVPVVKQIYKWFLEGYGDLYIAQKLNETEYLPPSKYRYEKGIVKGEKCKNTEHWYRSAVKRILTNPIYAGNMIGGRFLREQISAKSCLEQDSSKWTICENTHTPIISYEDFMKCQEIRADKRESYEKSLSKTHKPLPNLLKGLVVCSDCQKNMYRHRHNLANDKVRYSWTCKTYEQISHTMCSKKRIDESIIYNAVLSTLKSQIDIFCDLKSILNSSTPIQLVVKKKDESKTALHKLQKQIDKFFNMEAGLYADYVDGVINEKEYLDLKKRYKLKIAEINDEIDYLMQFMITTPIEEAKTNSWFEILSHYEKSKELSESIIKDMVQKIEIDENCNIEITLKYQDEYKKMLDIIRQAEERSA